MTTVTEPGNGFVHKLSGNTTLCGKDATEWSRAVTEAQRMGLVIYCQACAQSERENTQ